jgi:hypothetical protein
MLGQRDVPVSYWAFEHNTGRRFNSICSVRVKFCPQTGQELPLPDEE